MNGRRCRALPAGFYTCFSVFSGSTIRFLYGQIGIYQGSPGALSSLSRQKLYKSASSEEETLQVDKAV